MGRRLTLIAAALAALALSAGTATAASGVHQVGKTLKVSGIGEIRQGIGKVEVDPKFSFVPFLEEERDLGPTAFELPTSAHPRRATGTVNSDDGFQRSSIQSEAPTLDPHRPDSVKGGYSFLDEYRDYRKDVNRRDQSLQLKLQQLLLDVVDANGLLSPADCPLGQQCASVRASVKVDVKAYKPNAEHPFFDVGGTIMVEGHQHHWFVGVGTSPVSQRPFWDGAEFDVNRDPENDGTQSHVLVDNGFHPLAITIPLDSVHFQHHFEVDIHLDTVAIDDRGLESAAAARIVDSHLSPVSVPAGRVPHQISPAMSTAIQSLPRKFRPPPAAPRPAARCITRPGPRAGQLQLSSHPVTVGEGSGSALVLVTRTGGSRGAASAVVETGAGSASAGRDFTQTRTLIRFENGDTSPRVVEIPIREDRAAEAAETFRVSLGDPRCASLGHQRTTTATILDDDQSPPPPAPVFTLGGTVDGLEGSGLVLSDLGAVTPVSANGSFTLAGTHSAGEGYEINVTSQPHNPDQLCTVQNGAGTVGTANVTNIAVHCTTVAPSPGLDTTFGDGGRVSTAVGGGQGNAVVIQPSGGIVSAGFRTVGAGTDFALTRHDPNGALDTSFGTNGIATTDVGGVRDQAHDAALTPDGGIIAAGETDAAGVQKQDFALVRYNPDGTLNTSFGNGGIVTTDISGRADIADAVAVQGDGKILAAGLAVGSSGVGTDFVLARYNPGGSLDTSFGTNGTVTTDFGVLSHDGATAIAIQPDGKIVVTGVAGEDIALVRYTIDGHLDPTFGNAGTLTTDLGFVDVANGVALTPDGHIVVAGYTIGPKANNDFLLVRYTADGNLDRGFGTLGVVKTDFGAGEDFAQNLVIDSAGRIVVVGRASSSTILDMALARYNADGSLDTAFGTGGLLTADFHGLGEFGQDVAIDAQGRIVAAGYTANGGDLQFALMRANS